MAETTLSSVADALFPAKKRTMEDGRTVTIRPGRVEDAQAILAIKRQILQGKVYDSLLPEEYLLGAGEEADWVATSLGTPGSYLGVAEHAGRLVGVLYFKTSQEARCNHWGEFGMGIDENWRGLNIGTYLLDSLVDWATDHPRIEKICLKVFDANPGAYNLYLRYGFKEEGRLKNCLKLGNGQYSDAILMSMFVTATKQKERTHDE